jgi:hypothetical protein
MDAIDKATLTVNELRQRLSTTYAKNNWCDATQLADEMKVLAEEATEVSYSLIPDDEDEYWDYVWNRMPKRAKNSFYDATQLADDARTARMLYLQGRFQEVGELIRDRNELQYEEARAVEIQSGGMERTSLQKALDDSDVDHHMEMWDSRGRELKA